MKKETFATVALCLLCAGCQFTPSAGMPKNILNENSARTMSRSMKGWELYSWQSGASWKFVLTEGTNRLKNHDELMALPAATGVEEIKKQLMSLARGEQVFWNLRQIKGFDMPPEDTVKEISKYCKTRGIELNAIDW